MSRFIAGALLVIASVAVSGCPFQKTYLATRVEMHTLIWPGEDLHDITDGGQGFGLEIAPGDNTQPAMGPFYLGGAYSQLQTDDDSILHRLAVRARSSTLDHPSFSYPFAMVGFYLGHLDLDAGGSKFGAGLEGGIGFRLGSKAVAFDVEMLFEWGFFAAAYSVMDTRLGGGLTVQF